MSADQSHAERMEQFYERGRKAHLESVARGEHDGECEYEAIKGWFICNCHKRARLARGFTGVPELEWQYPICLGCDKEVDDDGDGLHCPRCAVSWNFKGRNGHFNDDHGDLWAQIREHQANAAKTVETKGGVL